MFLKFLDCHVVENGSKGTIKSARKIGSVQRTLRSWWKRVVACPVRQIDDYVKRVLRESTIRRPSELTGRERSHLTGVTYWRMEGGSNCLGRQQNNKRKEWTWCCDEVVWTGTSGLQSVNLPCRWQRARPWLLTSHLDLVFDKQPNLENSNRCIDEILKDTENTDI